MAGQYIGGSLSDYSNQQNSLAAARPTDIFDELRAAQARYSLACHAFASAAQEREQAAASLKELSDKASNVIHLAMQDPTVPQDSCPPPRANGRY